LEDVCLNSEFSVHVKNLCYRFHGRETQRHMHKHLNNAIDEKVRKHSLHKGGGGCL